MTESDLSGLEVRDCAVDGLKIVDCYGEDVYVGGLGSELAEAAAAKDRGPTIQSMCVRTMPKSGRSADDVLAYVGLAVDDIVTRATSLAR